MKEIMEIRDVVKVYGNRPVLDHIQLSISPGECVSIVGKNGSGKSTLLRLMAGLLHPSSGERIVQDEKPSIGYVPEQFPVIPFHPKEYLVSMSKIRGLSTASYALDLLETLGMGPHANTRMNHFSKGMLQKINIIQGVMGKPDLLLLDEPQSGLDLPSQKKVMKLLLDMKRSGTAIVMAVHESSLTERMADRVFLMSGGKMKEEAFTANQQKIQLASITFRGMSATEREILTNVEGFHQWLFQELMDPIAAISVNVVAIDRVIRAILDHGGSIISVEPPGGDSDLLDCLRGNEDLQGGSRVC